MITFSNGVVGINPTDPIALQMLDRMELARHLHRRASPKLTAIAAIPNGANWQGNCSCVQDRATTTGRLVRAQGHIGPKTAPEAIVERRFQSRCYSHCTECLEWRRREWMHRTADEVSHWVRAQMLTLTIGWHGPSGLIRFLRDEGDLAEDTDPNVAACWDIGTKQFSNTFKRLEAAGYKPRRLITLEGHQTGMPHLHALCGITDEADFISQRAYEIATFIQPRGYTPPQRRAGETRSAYEIRLLAHLKRGAAKRLTAETAEERKKLPFRLGYMDLKLISSTMRIDRSREAYGRSPRHAAEYVTKYLFKTDAAMKRGRIRASKGWGTGRAPQPAGDLVLPGPLEPLEPREKPDDGSTPPQAGATTPPTGSGPIANSNGVLASVVDKRSSPQPAAETLAPEPQDTGSDEPTGPPPTTCGGKTYDPLNPLWEPEGTP